MDLFLNRIEKVSFFHWKMAEGEEETFPHVSANARDFFSTARLIYFLAKSGMSYLPGIGTKYLLARSVP